MTYLPVVVEMSQHVAELLHLIRGHPCVVVQHVVVSGTHCSLVHRLRNQEEVVPKRTTLFF